MHDEAPARRVGWGQDVDLLNGPLRNTFTLIAGSPTNRDDGLDVGRIITADRDRRRARLGLDRGSWHSQCGAESKSVLMPIDGAVRNHLGVRQYYRRKSIPLSSTSVMINRQKDPEALLPLRSRFGHP